MGIPIPGKAVFILRRGPRAQANTFLNIHSFMIVYWDGAQLNTMRYYALSTRGSNSSVAMKLYIESKWIHLFSTTFNSPSKYWIGVKYNIFVFIEKVSAHKYWKHIWTVLITLLFAHTNMKVKELFHDVVISVILFVRTSVFMAMLFRWLIIVLNRIHIPT